MNKEPERGPDGAVVKTSALPYRGLPNELIEQIFDILDVENLSALKSCSCVDHLFRNLAQIRILRKTILLRGNTPSHSISLMEIIAPIYHPSLHFLFSPSPRSPKYSPSYHFLQVLDRSPRIASYIQSLTIECYRWPTKNDNSQHWLRADIALSFLIARLRNIRQISIVGSQQPPREIRTSYTPPMWSSVAQGLTAVFYSPVTVNNLTELDVTGVGLFPLGILNHCTSIKHLSLSSDFRFDPLKKHLVNAGSRPQLDYLHLRNLRNTKEMAGWFSLPTFPLDITQLQCLNVHPVKYPQLMDLEAFSGCAMSITHLHIQTQDVKVLSVCHPGTGDILEECTSPIPTFLQNFTNMRSITIDFEYRAWVSIDLSSTPLPWFKGLCNAIAEFPLKQRISRLTINIDFEDFPSEYMESINWKDLETSLSIFTYSLKFSLNIFGVTREVFDKLMEDELLQGLVRKGSNISLLRGSK